MHQRSTPRAVATALVVICAAALVGLTCGCQTTQGDAEDSLSNQMLGDAPRGRATDDSPKKRGVLWYRLALDDGRLDVHVRLIGPPPRTTFFLPGPWAGRNDFARDININGARGDSGPISFTISRSEGRIDVDSEDTEWVELAYSVKLYEADGRDIRFRPQMTEDMLFFYAPAVLVLPSEGLTRQVRDIPIEVHLPADWETLTTWPSVRRQRSATGDATTVHGFVAANPTQLRDAYMAAAAGMDVHHSKLSDASSLEVGFAPGFGADRDALAQILARIVDAYAQNLGTIGDVHVLARGLGGDSERHSRGVGRRGGFVLELPTGSKPGAHKLLIAHEALHLWNGHLLTPSPEVEPDTRWFKEGVTHYVALKTLNRLGMMDTEQVLAELEQAARYYVRNPAARSRESTETDRARLPYDRGVLLALGIDALLMKKSAGDVDITTWLQTLLESWGRQGRNYDPGDLQTALLDVAGSGDGALAQFWSRSVANGVALQPGDVFELAGLHWLRHPDGEPGRLLPLQRSNTPFRALFPGMRHSSNKESTP